MPEPNVESEFKHRLSRDEKHSKISKSLRSDADVALESLLFSLLGSLELVSCSSFSAAVDPELLFHHPFGPVPTQFGTNFSIAICCISALYLFFCLRIGRFIE